MSSTGPNEGTLRVAPFLSLSCAYMMLRPFFRPRSVNSASLRFEDWEVDTTSAFPGTGLGSAQEFSEKTHPHLRLDKMMVSIPKAEPGDQVYCTYHGPQMSHSLPSSTYHYLFRALRCYSRGRIPTSRPIRFVGTLYTRSSVDLTQVSATSVFSEICPCND
jgi:Protein of unknown function (DUF1479)